MRKKIIKITRKKIASITMSVMLLLGLLIVPIEADAATSSDDTIQYVEYNDYETFRKLIDGKKAPTYNGESDTGYVFGGWYRDKNDTNAILDSSEVTDGTKVYAKFVPAYVMGVKCQNHSKTTTGEATSIRVLSSIDSTRYSEVGLIVEKISLEDKNCVSVTHVKSGAIGAYRGDLNIYSKDQKLINTYTVKQVFGAESEYFTSINLSNISNFDMVICVQPYWKTLDGTQVLGLSRYIRVNDGEKGYLSVPVNLNSDAAVAAGLVSINIKNFVEAGYELESVEGGTVFEEMAYSVNGDTVKCVGNVSDIKNNASSNDIFANLRFKPTDSAKGKTYSENGFYQLEVTGEDFTDIVESELKGYDVWNIQY